MNNQTFLIVGKAPIAGLAKTRLAQGLGEEKAIELYKRFMETFFRRMKSSFPEATVLLFATPENSFSQGYFTNLLTGNNLDFKLYYQGKGNLFERILLAYCQLEDRYAPETFIHLTGTDIPDFPFDFIHNRKKLTFGPDGDGGFYYLGSSLEQAREIFTHDWSESSSQLGQSMISFFKERKFEFDLLPEWKDIDTVEDLQGRTF